ncbi:extracellular solute-binding protein [Brachybacterium muris]|uniref:ABC transporter substrate-binding protein n=1 Tax=Brachybacterium muris TaxID=219301 RepID=UPI0021A8520F|nr:extracellular solute-binding protein [Brachybacterium muris]MCT1997698.1 extracellular solute-binding protein [Brachybacterium muris]
MMRRRAVIAAAAASLVLAGCGSEGQESDGDTLTVWSMESLPDRMAATETILEGFTAETGIEVELVGIEEAQAPQLLMSAALSDDLPDVMMSFPLGLVQQMHALEMLDTETTARTLESLGEDTFAPKALELVSAGDTRLAVPSDGWSQVLVYRTDLFEEAGLEPPTTYEALQKASEELTGDGQFGITLPTDASDVFTQQTFEFLALGNGCELVDDAGEIQIDSPQCIETFELYKTLGGDVSPAGTQTVDTTRASYFNGQSAMVMWSTYILDELAGLRDDALPNCPQCADDPSFLVKNSGVVATITGPDGQDATGFGEIASFVPVDAGNPEASQKLVEYMMSTGYVDWLAMAPEGKSPMRSGSQDDPTEYADAWAQLEIGVDRKAPLADFYDEQTLEILTSVGEDIDRWAIPQGQGPLIGSFQAELPLAANLADLTNGSITPDEAADRVSTVAEGMVD